MAASHNPPTAPTADRHGRGRPSRRALRWAPLLLVASIAVVTTGCLTGDIKVKIDKSGSGTIDVEVLPYDELQRELKRVDAIPVVQNAVEGFDGGRFESTTVDGRIAYRAHIPFDDYRDLDDVLSDGFEVAGTNLRVFSEFDLSEIDGGWRLDATLAPDVLSDALRTDPSLQQLLDSEGLVALNSDLRLTIALPGRIVRTNGERVAAGTAKWSLKKDAHPTLMMVTEPKPLLTFVQKIFLGAALAIVLGVMFMLWGSRTAWKSGSAERKERRRAKKMTFGPSRGSGVGSPGAGWDNSGPMQPVVEGTVPTSGPMPPRMIPTIHDSTAAAATTGIVTPPTSSLPPVAPPVAPVVDPNVPDPFAPHVPGVPPTGVPQGAPHGEAPPPGGGGYPGTQPVSPPVAPVVDPNVPDPFAPHIPGVSPTQPPVDDPLIAPPVAPARSEADQDPWLFDAIPEDDVAPGSGVIAEPAVEPEPTQFEQPGFAFDGTPGWFSSETEDHVAGGVPVPEPATTEPATTEPAGGEPLPRGDAGPTGGDQSGGYTAGAYPAVDEHHDVAEARAGVEPHAGAEPSTSHRDRPVGHRIPAAWYPDPDDPRRYRWWNGAEWTDYVSGDGS